MGILDEIATKTSAEVFHCTTWGVALPATVVDELIAVASENPRQRARLCMHPSADDVEQQMLIVMGEAAHDAAHRHETKRETMVPIRGLARYQTFDATGNVTGSVLLGDDHLMYLSSPLNTFHALQILTPWFAFWEFAKGPFTPTSTIPAPWETA